MTGSVHQANVLHRAAELARSGQFSDWAEIADELRREGYQEVDEAFGKMSVRDQVDIACGRARNA